MSEALVTVSPLQVIDAAIEKLSEPDGYTSNTYHTKGSDNVGVGAHCAIGGVEHAIWKLTSENVSGDRMRAAYRTTIDAQPTRILEIFEQVMVALNVVAREMYPNGDDGGDDVDGVEDVSLNIGEDHEANREAVLAVFREARERLAAREFPADALNPALMSGG